MTTFIYHYLDAQGRPHLARQKARDAAECCSILAERGIYPVSLVGVPWSAVLAPRGPRPRQLAMCFHQLAVALESGVPLLEALHLLREAPAGTRVRQLLARLEAGMLAGRRFSEALQDEPGISPMLCQWIAIGERQGRLAEVLAEVTRYMEEQVRFKKRLEQQLLYPMIVLTAVLVLGAFLSFGLLPVLTRQFMGFEAEVPGILRAFLLVHDALAAGGWVWLLLAAAVLLLWGLAARRREQAGRGWNRLLLRLPLAKDLCVLRWYVPFARLLGQMLMAGVPAGEALAALEQYFARSSFAAEVRAIAQATAHGGKLSQAIAACTLVPPLARQMLYSGERVGRLPEALGESAAYHEEILLERLSLWVRFVEPVAIVILGILVLFLALGLFVPVLDSYQALLAQ